jgi:hypothetical protein
MTLGEVRERVIRTLNQEHVYTEQEIHEALNVAVENLFGPSFDEEQIQIEVFIRNLEQQMRDEVQ